MSVCVCARARARACACTHMCIQSRPTLCDVWTVVWQTLLSMELSRQEHWSGLSSPTPHIFPTQGLNLCLCVLSTCRQIPYLWHHLGSHMSVSLFQLVEVISRKSLTFPKKEGTLLTDGLLDLHISFFLVLQPAGFELASQNNQVSQFL